MKLFIIGMAWALGLILGSKWNIPFQFTFFLLIFLLISCFLLAWRYRKLLFYALYMLAFLSGLLRLQLSEKPLNEETLSYYHGQDTAFIQGTIDSEVTGRGRVLRFELGHIQLKVGDDWKEIRGRALVEAPGIRDYKYGDSLYLEGQLKPILEAGEYYRYFEKQGITTLLSFPRIRLLESERGPPLNQWIYNLRLKLSFSLSSFLPEPQGSLAQALFLGLRQEIPGELNQDFKRTGTTHLLAISGMNISIFAGMVMVLGLWIFGRRHSLYLAFAFLLVWLYTFLAGMNPPVVRAAFMASVYFLAEYLGRPKVAAPALALSAIIMTALDPQALWDVSFQLSFMAMMGLTFLSPPFIKLRGKFLPASTGSPDFSGFPRTTWDIAAVSLGAILATLPLTAYYFRIIPLAGLPATILASLALPYIIILSTLTAMAGLIFSPAAQVLGWIDWLLLSYMILAVKAFAFWPFVSLKTGQFPLWIMAPYYGALVAALGLSTRKNRAWELLSILKQTPDILRKVLPHPGLRFKKALLLCLVIANFLAWAALFSSPDGYTHVYFLDVGSGDSIFVETSSGHQVLIDGGPDPYKARLYLGKKMPFWDRSLDLMVLTHPHQDHLGGLPQVLNKYKVGYILDSQLPLKSYSYESWQKLIKEEGAKYLRARDGLIVDLGNNTRLEALHPPAEAAGSARDIDDNALVLRLTIGKVSFLLPSDNREKGQRETVLKHPDLWSTVLAAPHHGSEGAVVPLFLEAASPSAIVISSGQKDRARQEKALSKLRDKVEFLFTTSEKGTIEFITDGEKLWVRTER